MCITSHLRASIKCIASHIDLGYDLTMIYEQREVNSLLQAARDRRLSLDKLCVMAGLNEKAAYRWGGMKWPRLDTLGKLWRAIEEYDRMKGNP